MIGREDEKVAYGWKFAAIILGFLFLVTQCEEYQENCGSFSYQCEQGPPSDPLWMEKGPK